VWLYAAVEPKTGESFWLYLPRLDGECFEVFLKEFEKSYPDEEIVLVLDGAPGHRSGQEVEWPSGIEGLLGGYQRAAPSSIRWSGGSRS
jgi:hypothetical protein